MPPHFFQRKAKGIPDRTHNGACSKTDLHSPTYLLTSIVWITSKDAYIRCYSVSSKVCVFEYRR